MSQDRHSKTEKATPRRLQKAREEGQFLSSKEFVGALQFVVFVGLLFAFGGYWIDEAKGTATLVLRQAFRSDLQAEHVINLGMHALHRLLKPLAFAAVMLVSMTMAAQLTTTKFGFSVKKLTPSVKRMNPVSQLKELPKKNIPAAIQAFLMLTVFGTSIYYLIRSELDTLLLTSLAGLGQGLPMIAAVLEDLFWNAAWLFIVFGMADLLRQHRRMQKELRMTKDEVKREMRETEGDPQIKARVRRLRRELVSQQMMKEVPNATAVIVNPTHYAVALKYEHGENVVPIVVAKGRNNMAQRIRELAKSRNVPLVENPPLAQALYKSVKLGQEIPADLYRVVAEVLAYVYTTMREEGNRGVPREIPQIP